jgi:3-hydroxyacyl-[acyl-carrier-protein] dehydratase
MSDFNFVDRILEVTGETLKAQKNLTINEDYLLDHFSGYPVMPGVLMTQSLVEAAGWWLKKKTDFKVGEISLKQVKNVRFANFLKPGECLTIEVVNKSLNDDQAEFQAKGKREEKIVLSMQFTLNYKRFKVFLREEEAAQYRDRELQSFNLLFPSPQK